MVFYIKGRTLLRVVKNWVLKKILGSSMAKVMGDKKNGITRNFMIFTLSDQRGLDGWGMWHMWKERNA